ncbi:pyridoxamine 5'-phosphate oxidase family protein [Halorientalis salina]|uniref:pyridoxamine 5'-phosphate oxidase family protein n=1 Tax=Halorientalis salina TaxID=2932266 RepID=UPI0010AC5E3D|nr:pyridoxamine 5'-phosphate oxidase family protein [Halorientalis salina]
MPETDPVEMTETERDDFLGNGGTGVISLSTTGDDAPHSLPVSYGYDESESTFYFRLAVSRDSSKDDLEGRSVSFVTYGQDDDVWKSVVATGRLEETTDEGIETATLEGLQHVDIPLVDIFGKPPRDVTFEFYRLVPEELTGRHEEPTEI